MYETMRLMYKNEGGIVALYRGILPTVAGVAPYVSLASRISPTIKNIVSADRAKGWVKFHDV